MADWHGLDLENLEQDRAEGTMFTNDEGTEAAADFGGAPIYVSFEGEDPEEGGEESPSLSPSDL